MTPEGHCEQTSSTPGSGWEFTSASPMSTAETSDYGYPTGRLNTISNPSTTTDQVHPLPKADSVAVTWGTEPRNRSRQTGHCRSQEDRPRHVEPRHSVHASPEILFSCRGQRKARRQPCISRRCSTLSPDNIRRPLGPGAHAARGRAFRTIGGHHAYPPHLRKRC